VSQTLQLDKVTVIRSDLHHDDALRLLVEWTPRWQGFVTSIQPALARSGPRLAGEATRPGLPYSGLVISLLLESLLIFTALALPREIDRLRPYAPPKLEPYEVIYYSGDELPRTEDLSGSHSGASARAGGQEAHHRTQTIHIARGSSLSGKVVDAPNLKLPSGDAVANLLAFQSKPEMPATPAAPSADGLHSSLTAPALAENVIPPAQANLTRDSSRGRLALNSVVPPAPDVSTHSSRKLPFLSASVIPPVPNTPSGHALFAPRLEGIIAPAPNISRQRTRTSPSLATNVIAPPSTRISAAEARSTPALTPGVIPPAPVTNGHEVPSTRVQVTNVAVVPPPVSAPERDDARGAKLNLPAPSVVAPPPSADSAHSLRRLESGVLASSPAVVPPPPTQTPSFMSSIIGKIFGTQDVVPPPPSVPSAKQTSGGGLAANVVPPPPNVSGTKTNRASSGSLTANIVPPPPAASDASTKGTSRFSPRAPGGGVVPPPPAVSGAESSRISDSGASHRASPGANVVPPPPSVSESGSISETNRASGASIAANVVPPPPSVNSGSGNSGRGGSSLMNLDDRNAVLAPPESASSNNEKSGVVVTAQPGSKIGVPGNTSESSLAMSPTGSKPGLGGSGGGSSIVHGAGSGSGLIAEKGAKNSGAGKTGSGRGFDQTSHAGISATPGPGGAGSLAAGTPVVPGVDVQGGSTMVTLPSFGSDGGDPNLPRRSNVKADQGPAITIVATSRSGGAFNFYGELPGDNYTVYIDTSLGMVVLQFAEANPAPRAQNGTLTGPEAIRASLPANLPRARMVVKCKLDTTGNVKNLQVLEPGPATMTAKIVAALSSWKFRPAMRGSQPVEINAILGFNIDTNDRY
jgi:Gram-negative bacterial TonB protein C-terminal